MLYQRELITDNMEEAIKQIGDRLKGLREVLEAPVAEMASLCGITEEQYLRMESGEGDVSVSNLQKISKKYGIPLDVLMFGEEPHMNNYFLTRKNKGMTVERRKAYKYQSLASGFRGRKADPFVVTVEPDGKDTVHEVHSHPGQEFNLVLEGRMELTIGSKKLELGEGDSVYFDSTQPHCMRAIGETPVKFLAIIL